MEDPRGVLAGPLADAPPQGWRQLGRTIVCCRTGCGRAVAFASFTSFTDAVLQVTASRACGSRANPAVGPASLHKRSGHETYQTKRPRNILSFTV